MPSPRTKHLSAWAVRATWRLWAVALSAWGIGCGSPAGVIFPPVRPQIVFPAPPDRPRIRYVGELRTEADLKPAVPFGKSWADRLFGAAPVQSFDTPLAVCTDNNGRLFIADTGQSVVHVLDLVKRQYTRITPGTGQTFLQPVGVAMGPSESLYVTDSLAGVVYQFDRNGRQIAQIGFGELSRPCGLVYDFRNSRLIVADSGNHDVAVFSPSGILQRVVGRRGTELGQFNFPTYVAIDHDGRLYVSDSLNFRVQQFSPELAPLRQIGSNGDTPGSFGQPKGIAVDSQNHLYVVDSNFEVVQIFDANGTFLLDFGAEGNAPAEFWLPAGIFIDKDNRIWIADSYNHRVQVFDYLPE